VSSAQINPNELSDKTALVTGGTKGIGEAIVKQLRQAGATVMTTARSKPANLDLPDLFIEADISTREGVQKVVEGVLARLGGLDILVNNVGGSSAPSGGALALSDDDWQHTFNTNLFSAVRFVEKAQISVRLRIGCSRHCSHRGRHSGRALVSRIKLWGNQSAS
jgi:NAD(P)-dependent dehydrogenase (short-subunit alcohol dehydrogenase family)